jgi:hypothetical protein
MTDLIRVGRWQDVLPDVEPDLLCFDAPFSKRTHDGFRSGSSSDDEKGIDEYAHWTPEHVHEHVSSWAPRTKGWTTAITDHVLVPSFEAAFAAVGLLSFAPIPIVLTGMGFRKTGDGPANWTLQLIVARPRRKEFLSWNKRHGKPEEFYLGPASRKSKDGRGKPDWLMRAIVRDYSFKGDLVVDTHAGWAATGCAAIAIGRRFVGAEVDSKVAQKGRKLLAEVVERVGVPVATRPERLVQRGLFDEPKEVIT